MVQVIGLAVIASAHSSLADPPAALAPRDPKSVFLIAKSENKNQVHYGVRLDESCNVVGASPIYGYWRMLEKQGQVEPILAREVRAYGIDPAQRIERNGDATTIYARMNAVPDRQLRVTVARRAGRCEAEAAMSIAGSDAHLDLIYIRLRWPFGVSYILLRGSRMVDGRSVEEKI